MGVLSSKHEGKLYMVPVSTPYQFHQEIEGFKENYGQTEDNEAIKNMTYIEKKALLVKNFGVLKAQRQTEQMISNNVKDDGVTNREGKGTRDDSLFANAKKMDQEIKAQTKHGENSLAMRKKQMYSKEGLLPEDVLNLIPYKQTYEALQKEDSDALATLLSSFVRISMESAYQRFPHIESKREKKNIMKSHVYLDALITLYRVKSQLGKSIEVLAQDFFKGLNIDAMRSILEKFTEVQQVNRGEIRGKAPDDLPDVKYVCTKELEKILLCNIIGVAVHLAFN